MGKRFDAYGKIGYLLCYIERKRRWSGRGKQANGHMPKSKSIMSSKSALHGHMGKSRSIMSSKSDLNGHMEKNTSVISTQI